MRSYRRRQFLGLLGAAASLSYLDGCAEKPKGRVVIVGGGFGGATCAKFLKLADPAIEVTLVEKSARFTTCPFSNHVLGGFKRMAEITHSYDGLRCRGVHVVNDTATNVDPHRKVVSLQGGVTLSYDRLVLSPGIDMIWNAIEGYDEAAAQIIPHAWKAGSQTFLLRRQLAAMADGGLVVIAAPEYPYRCPPAPYERASCIAYYLMRHKPRSKILILDAKDGFTKQKLFMEGWEKLYPGMIEWVSRSGGGEVTRVDAKTRTLYCGAGTFTADVANVVPPQQAGRIARKVGAAKGDGEWCRVDGFTFESMYVPNVHLVGDAILPGEMPKSSFAANSQAKAAAAALVSLLNGREVREPFFMNTCYSLLAPDYGISVNAAYRATPSGIVAILGSGGESPLGAPYATRKSEATYTEGWYASMIGEIFS